MATKDDIDEDLFTVTEIVNGTKKVQCNFSVFPENGKLEEKLDNILTKTPKLSVLDISKVEKFSSNVYSLCRVLVNFIICSDKYERLVLVHAKHVALVRGKITGLLMNDIKSTFGDKISLPSLDTSFQVRNLFNTQFVSSAIVDHQSITKNRGVKHMLDELLSIHPSEIPYEHYGSIINSCKKLMSKVRNRKCNKNNIVPRYKEQEATISALKETIQFKDDEPNPYHPKRSKKCYICKGPYVLPIKAKRDSIWKTYPRLCYTCAETNFHKRKQKVNLEGKYAIITGGRIKIGFELALKMLRDGCTVLVTTRFPHDASKRFSQETDFDAWKSRLHVYALDMKDIQGIYKFVAHVKKTFPHLDILVNNAAQTIRRPMDFFRHMMDYECIPRDHIPTNQQEVLVQQEVLNYGYYKQHLQRAEGGQCVDDARDRAPTVVELEAEEIEMEPDCKRLKRDEPVVQELIDEFAQSDAQETNNVRAQSDMQGTTDILTQSDAQETNSVPARSDTQGTSDVLVLSDAQEPIDVREGSKSVICQAEEDQWRNADMEAKRSNTFEIDDNESTSNAYDIVCSATTPRKSNETTFPSEAKFSPQTSQNTVVPYANKVTNQRKRRKRSFKRSQSMDAGCFGSRREQVHEDASRDLIIDTGNMFSSTSRYFPRGATDADGQQLDLRRKNSWRMVLGDVPVTELVEILVVNVIAPFLLNKELKSHMRRSPAARRFIVNVSAMEGQFNRASKTKFHPHTNMGKAALNMMTRTAALEYKDAGIYMTSVDTGWVTDERPFHEAQRLARRQGFVLPLDSTDGAARIYDPIVTGLRDTEKKPHYAVFLKDYKVHPW